MPSAFAVLRLTTSGVLKGGGGRCRLRADARGRQRGRAALEFIRVYGIDADQELSGSVPFQMAIFKIWARQVADDFNTVLHKIARRVIRKIVEIVVTDLDLVRYFNDPSGA